MWFHNFLVAGSFSETGLSPLLFLPVHRVQNFNVSPQNWAQFYFWTVPAELCKLDCTLTFFFFPLKCDCWVSRRKKEIKIALRVLALLCRNWFQTTMVNGCKDFHEIYNNKCEPGISIGLSYCGYNMSFFCILFSHKLVWEDAILFPEGLIKCPNTPGLPGHTHHQSCLDHRVW